MNNPLNETTTAPEADQLAENETNPVVDETNDDELNQIDPDVEAVDAEPVEDGSESEPVDLVEGEDEIEADSLDEDSEECEGSTDAEDICTRISNAELDVKGAEREVEDAKEDLKLAKENLERCVKRLRNIASEAGNDSNRPLFVSGATNKPVGAGEEVEGGNILNGWENIPIEEWVDGLAIKGFGAKKVEAFLDIASTYADIEKLRMKASTEHMDFYEVLPNGIGEKMANEIEEQYLNRVSKPYVAPIVLSENEKRAIDLMDAADLGSEFDEDVWNEGWSAWESNQTLEECPYDDSPEERDEWIRGWQSCEVAPPAEEEAGPNDSTPDSEPIGEDDQQPEPVLSPEPVIAGSVSESPLSMEAIDNL